ncbi:hypothetical protein EIN_281800 [Entamoeba invadens IP1]|uniref:VPS9 domain-containing protein n=1 Tax=Entamoeba invadens IP1 TaxID=370355 RepID=A0A0A1U2N9_ENTIV|nr:hypothetical protein EIN_281800 [Entamoeba invadens IP1]ELP85809.1 hypothetical protein EIN_281800 [Entamoeba invadens IP1]|eukprot:XP_004185155.1 hypothetical protein EIN_281800 [Entamoeba invadens IP1]
MDLSSVYKFFETNQVTPQSKHMLLMAALHYEYTNGLLEIHMENVYRSVNELLLLINVNCTPVKGDGNLKELVTRFFIVLSLYRLFIAQKQNPQEIGMTLLDVAGKILYLTAGNGILDVLVGNPLRGFSDAQIDTIQHDDILYNQLSQIKTEFETQVSSLKNEKSDAESKGETVTNTTVFKQNEHIFKVRATERQLEIIKQRFKELKPNAELKISSNMDLKDLKKVESLSTALKMPSLLCCLSQLVAVVSSNCDNMYDKYSKAMDNTVKELKEKMFVEEKFRCELMTAIEINVFDSCVETVIGNYRKRYEKEDQKIQSLMNQFENTVHPFHFKVESQFLLEEKGIVGSAYIPVLETFKRISMAKYPYQKTTLGLNLKQQILDCFNGFCARTKKRGDQAIGPEQENPLYMYLLFKSKYPYVFSDAMFMADFNLLQDERGYWMTTHLGCVNALLETTPLVMNNNLISSFITDGHEGTVAVIGMEGIGKTELVKSLNMKIESNQKEENVTKVTWGTLSILEWDVRGDQYDIRPIANSKVKAVVLCVPNVDGYSITSSFTLAAPLLNSLKEPVPFLLLMTRHDIYPFTTLENFPKLDKLPFPTIKKIDYGLCSVKQNYGIYESFAKLRNN